MKVRYGKVGVGWYVRHRETSWSLDNEAQAKRLAAQLVGGRVDRCERVDIVLSVAPSIPEPEPQPVVYDGLSARALVVAIESGVVDAHLNELEKQEDGRKRPRKSVLRAIAQRRAGG